MGIGGNLVISMVTMTVMGSIGEYDSLKSDCSITEIRVFKIVVAVPQDRSLA